MTYTVQLTFFIDEEVERTYESVQEIVEEIFDCCNCSAYDIKVIDANGSK